MACFRCFCMLIDLYKMKSSSKGNKNPSTLTREGKIALVFSVVLIELGFSYKTLKKAVEYENTC